MEMNFYIWLALTIAVTAYAWVVITRWAKKDETQKVSSGN
jgi:heme exporter protein D